MPHRLPTGLTLDSGDYAATMDAALALADYAEWRQRQARLRGEGRYLGIGLATFAESSGAGPSMAMGTVGFRRAGPPAWSREERRDCALNVELGGQPAGRTSQSSWRARR
jgi:hypothetical protein